MKVIYTDIDYTLSLATEMLSHNTKWGNIYKFNAKAVAVYNEILEKTGAVPVISSDWRNNFTLKQLQEIFTEWAKIKVAPIDVTGSTEFTSVYKVAENRAKEILEHVRINKHEAWVAIDDYNLSYWIDELHFVHTPRSTEGIKQTGKKEKVIENFLKQLSNDESNI